MHAYLVLAIALAIGSPAYADTTPKECGEKPTQQARTALAQDDPASLRVALICVTQSVEALEQKLDALVSGEITFSGPVTAPEFLYGAKGADE